MTRSMDLVASQVVQLNNFDACLSPSNSDIILFFENTAGIYDFMESTILKQAFYKALSKFPIYLGYLRQRTDGGLEIAIDKDDLNMPNYIESTSEIHFTDLKSSNYNPSTWPADLVTTDVFSFPGKATGEIKMLNVHIVRFKESSGIALFISGAHAIADGTGFYRLISHWADEARSLRTGEPAPEILVTFDRRVIVGNPADERAEMDALTQFNYGTTSPAALALSSTPVIERNYAFWAKVPKNELQGTLYRLSYEKLERLREEVQKFAPSSTRLSTNDILTALVSKTLAQAKTANNTKLLDQLGDLNDPKNTHLICIACNIRHRLGISDLNYIGNAQYLALVADPIERSMLITTPETLAEIAVKVRTLVNNVQAPQIRTWFDLHGENPEQFIRLTIMRMMYGAYTIVSSQSRLGLYTIDFGNGIADFATSRPTRLPNTVTILPVRPPSKDLLISITDIPVVIENIRTNEFWRTIADILW